MLKLSGEIDDETEITAVIKAFEKLHPKNQDAFLALSDFASHGYTSVSSWLPLSEKHKKVVAIWGSNNWNEMVFEIGCRINHACAPNLETSWNVRLGQQIWTAMRDIRKGEELTGTYLYDIESHDTEYRRSELKKHWGFECECDACENGKDVLEGMIVEKY